MRNMQARMRPDVNRVLAVGFLAWMMAIGGAEDTSAAAEGVRSLQEATTAESISIMRGFRVERLCSALAGVDGCRWALLSARSARQ
jgi:hypothetical protein